MDFPASGRAAGRGLPLIAALCALMACGPAEEPVGETLRPNRLVGQPRDGVPFVPTATCAECHLEQYVRWSGSHHDLAMQEAEDGTVLADFENACFEREGLTSRFFRKGDGFYVHTGGPDGRMADFEVRYTFGVTPLQQYLIEFPGGRLQSLTIAWDTVEKRWFDLYPDEAIAHDDPLHWAGRYQRWNLMCADCHSTNLRKGYDPGTDSYSTTWSEINVGCEACHGSGAAHVEWARALPEGDAPIYADTRLRVVFKANDAKTEVEACAPCHSRRHRIGGDGGYGPTFLDEFMPELLREGLYHADGQILEEVYVYGSILQSKMHRWGVRCSDCHEPHSLTRVVIGNALCVRCHQEKPDPRFPTLQSKSYDTPAHHFHPAGSSGAQCVDCHMLAKNYMVIDRRYDHSFRVPRPDLSVRLGTPNTCNECHTDRSAQWAADTVADWYGPTRRQGAHYGDVIAAGRSGASDGASSLLTLARDPEQPAIVRATALELLRGYGAQAAAALVAATRDEEPLVRAVAVGGLDRLPSALRLASAAPLLADPIRAVRVEAARVLASVPRESFSPAQVAAFENALGEYSSTQMVQADTPPAHLNLAVVLASQGQPERAEQSYLTSIRLDPGFLPARFNLANLYNQLSRNADAEAILGEGLRRTPEEGPDRGELHYSLGLLLAEEERLDEADRHLARATELLPDRPRVLYNRALLLQRLGRDARAEEALLEAHDLAGRDPDILYALAVFYAQREDWPRALPYAEELTKLSPGAPGPRQFLEQIRGRLSSRPNPG